MTARTGMASLITTLRGMTNAGTTDYTIGSTSYWDDDQLQSVLDRCSTKITEERLEPRPVTNTGGSISYYDYQSRNRFFEQTTGGTAKFFIANEAGSIAGTALWSADYDNGRVSFVNDTAGLDYFLTGTSYDVYAAAAEVWYQKAAHASELIDFSTQGNSIKRAHVSTACMKMAERYERMAHTQPASSSLEMIRGDQC